MGFFEDFFAPLTPEETFFMMMMEEEEERELSDHDYDCDDTEDDDFKYAPVVEEEPEWYQTCEDGEVYGLDPRDYASELLYELAIEDFKREWRKKAEDGSMYGVSKYDYDLEWEYEDALDAAKHPWRALSLDGVSFGLYPFKYETQQEFMRELCPLAGPWQKLVSRAEAEEYGLSIREYSSFEDYYDAMAAAKAQWGEFPGVTLDIK